jgi:hypothetical protein
MARIISSRERIERVEYRRLFEYRDMPGAGFGFDADVQGNVNPESLNPAARENYEKCMNGAFDVVDRGLVIYRSDYWTPAVLKCDCGANVPLEGFTNTCDRCHADYNKSGQRLADRSQWGEETGESVADILRIR